MLSTVEAGMLTAMKDIRENGPETSTVGLCQNVTDRMPFAVDAYKILVGLFQSWDMFSGNKTFPVPMGDVDPGDAYLYQDEEYWGRETEYGRNRWALLEHCIVQLELKAK